MLLVFAVHIILCLVYYLLSMFWLSGKERLCRLIISLSVPFLPLLTLIIADSFKGKPGVIDDVDLLSNKRVFKYVTTIDKNKEKDTVPLEEVLIVNDDLTKRKILLDIFKENPDEYIKELKLALGDADTETSHYASSALMEINRKFLNSLITLSRQVKENPDDYENNLSYISLIYKYIKSDILDVNNKTRYQREYIKLAGKYLMNGDRSISVDLYKALVLYLLDLGEEESAGEMAELLIRLYPESEKPYFALMQVYYQSDKILLFKETVERLQSSSVILTKNGLSTLRYFLGNY